MRETIIIIFLFISFSSFAQEVLGPFGKDYNIQKSTPCENMSDTTYYLNDSLGYFLRSDTKTNVCYLEKYYKNNKLNFSVEVKLVPFTLEQVIEIAPNCFSIKNNSKISYVYNGEYIEFSETGNEIKRVKYINGIIQK